MFTAGWASCSRSFSRLTVSASPGFLHGLEQVVEGTLRKCLHRVVVEDRHEHDLDVDVAAVFTRIDSVTYCVLHERQQRDGRTGQRERRFVDPQLVAPVLLVVVLPLQLAGFLRGPITSLVWLPMHAFEAPLGFWLIVKGVAARGAAISIGHSNRMPASQRPPGASRKR